MTDRNTIEELIKTSKDYDPDRRYMAASDLCAFLLKEDTDLDVNIQRQICAVFLEHLDDASIEVQGNAVRCIKRTVSKIHHSQVSEVIEKLGQCLISGKKEFIDIYSTCLKGLIADVSDEYATIVSETMLPILLEGIRSGQEQLQEEATDTLTELFKRFASELQGYTDRSYIVNVITNELNSDSLSIRKKATQCLGAFAVILPPEQLQQLLQLIIEKIQSKNKSVFTFIQCLSAVSRTVGYKLSSYLQEIIPLLYPLSEIDHLTIDSPNIDFEHEKIENCLAVIESLILRCPKDIIDFIPGIFSHMMKLLSYDPNYSYVDEPMDEDDWSDSEESDAFSDAAGDDSSWKVRRAAVKVIEAIIKSRPESLSLLYEELVERLLDRFKEREENVKLDIFKTFSALIKSILIGDAELQDESLPNLVRTRSSAGVLNEQVPVIIEGVLKEFSEKNMKIRQGITSFLMDLSLSLPEKLAEELPLLMEELKKNINDTNNSNIRMDSLVIFKRVFRSGNRPDVFAGIIEEILPAIQNGISDTYFKISAECLRIAGAIVRALPDIPAITDLLLPAVLDRLSRTDIDQEVKQASIYSTATIISSSGHRLPGHLINQALHLINERLKNEITRLVCLKAWSRISNSHFESDSNSPYEEAADEMIKMLKKNERSLKVSVLETMIIFVQRFSLSPQITSLICEELLNNINEGDLHIAEYSLEILAHIIDNNINTQFNLQFLLTEMNELAKSRLVQGGSLNKLTETYATLVTKGKIQPQEIVRQLSADTSEAHRHTLESTAQCIAAAVLAGPDNYRNSFLQTCVKQLQSSSDQVELSALCIGQIGKFLDLSGKKEISNTLISMFDQGAEDTKICASVALGSLAVGNLNNYLPIIIEEFSVQSHKYLLLNSLKEVINEHFNYMNPYVDTILPRLFEHADNEEESVRNLVSECLGKLFLVNTERIGSEIEANLRSGNLLARSTVASSVKYSANSKLSDTSSLEKIVISLEECLNDYDVNLKRACLISLNAVAHNIPNAIRYQVSEILDLVYPLTRVNPDLIRKVDLGPFVHQIDDGMVLRKAAYGFIETVLNNLADKIDPSLLTECLIPGLEDISEEVQIQVMHIIEKLSAWASGSLMVNVDTVSTHLKKTITNELKAINSNEEVERANDMLRACFRCLDALNNTELEENIALKELTIYAMSVPELASIMQAIKSQRETWIS